MHNPTPGAAPLAHSPTNDPDKATKEFMGEVREFGRLTAQGKDALPMLAVKFASAVHDGLFSMDKDTDGKTVVAKVYEEYVTACGKKAVHEHTPAGIKAQISKLTQIGLAAQKTTCDFPSTLAKVFTQHQAMQSNAKETGIKPKAAYPAYVDAARLQTEQDDDLSDEQISAVIRKPDPKEQTLEQILEGVEKKLNDVITGEKGVKDEAPELVQARELIQARLAALITAKETSVVIAKAVALGLMPDPALAVVASTEETSLVPA